MYCPALPESLFFAPLSLSWQQEDLYLLEVKTLFGLFVKKSDLKQKPDEHRKATAARNGSPLIHFSRLNCPTICQSMKMPNTMARPETKINR